MSHPESSSSRRALVLGALALALASNPLPAQPQTVRGRVLESESSRPVAAAGVMLLDTAFVSVAGTATDSNGAFTLEAPGPGAYYVLTESLGYSPSMDGILELGEGGSITVAIYLKPKPIVLDSIRVAVERAQVFQHLEGAGYNERQTRGFGYFITPDKIQQRNPRTMRDLFRDAPGIQLVHGSLGTGIAVIKPTIRGPTCPPNVYVDGALVNADPEWGGLEGVVDITQIAAVELYTRASNVPAQWGGTNAGCGILLIWTR